MDDSPKMVEQQIAGVSELISHVDDIGNVGKAQHVGVDRSSSPWDCCICLQTPQNPVVTRCGHLFCRDDLLRWLSQSSSSCPLCAQRLPPGLDAFTPIFCHPSSSHTPLPPPPEEEVRTSRTRRRPSNNQARPRVTSMPPNPYPFAPFASTPTPAFPSASFPSVAFPSVAFPTVAFPSPPSFSMPASIGHFSYLPAVAMSTGSLNQFGSAHVPIDLSHFNKAFHFSGIPQPYVFWQTEATEVPLQTATQTDEQEHAKRSFSKLLSVAALCLILGMLWSGRRDVFAAPGVRDPFPL